MITLTARFKKRDNIVARFQIEDLTVTQKNIDFEELELYLNDKEYDGNFSSFRTNHVPANEVLTGLINAYLRNDTEDLEYINGWEIFDTLKDLQRYDSTPEYLKKYKTPLLTAFPQMQPWGEIIIYELQLATDEERFYTVNDYCMLTDENSVILTDMEGFYDNAFIDELKEINRGTKPILYITKYLKDNIKKILEDYAD